MQLGELTTEIVDNVDIHCQNVKLPVVVSTVECDLVDKMANFILCKLLLYCFQTFISVLSSFGNYFGKLHLLYFW